jgi:very-short-patch-repair endonuclease
MPAVNVPLIGYEVDCLWPAARLVVELDGYGSHRLRRTFEADRIRDAELQLAGYRVLRITDRRMRQRPESVTAAVRELLRES